MTSYLQLAFRNVRKSYKDYSLYFVTLTFSVVLLYLLRSFEMQSSILELDPSQGTAVASLIMVLNTMSVIISVVFALLIIYANQFLIRRRKQELGLYTLMGMPIRKIRIILFFETLIAALASLIVGFTIGIGLSQVMAMFSASILSVNASYTFIFSVPALFTTTLIFSAIYTVVICFNTLILGRFTLLDMLTAHRQNESIKAPRTRTTVLLLVLGVSCIAYAYTISLQPYGILNQMVSVIVVGAIGTLLLFKALSGFLLQSVQHFENHYYSGLNAFNFRQLSSKISTTYRSMSIICLMLLTAITALVTAFNLNNVLAQFKDSMIAYDIAATHTQPFDLNDFDTSQIKDSYQFYVLNGNASDKVIYPVIFIAQHDANQSLRRDHQQPIQLLDNQFAFYKHPNLPVETPDFSKYGLTDSVATAVSDLRLTNSALMNSLKIVVSDTTFQQLELQLTPTYYTNINTHDIQSIATLQDTLSTHVPDGTQLVSARDVELEMAGTELLFTYLGFYIGAVFLICSCVLLALQQLSEASDNIHRYSILTKIGVEESVKLQSITTQLTLYFALPLIIALVHAVVGIKAANLTLSLGGLAPSSPLIAIIVTLGFMFAYGLYGFTTLKSVQRIVLQ